MKVTIKDVAKKAQVSISTVSNVLNNNLDKVSEEKYKKISKIIEELGYIPNNSAKNLSKKNNIIVGFLNKNGDSPNENNVVNELTYYLNYYANLRGVEFIIININFNGNELYNCIIKSINKYNLTHIIFYGLSNIKDELEKIGEINIKKVSIEVPLYNKNSSLVSTNNYKAQQNLIQNVFENELFKNVLYYSGNEDSYVANIRRQAFEDYMNSKDINYDLIIGSFYLKKAFEDFKFVNINKYDIIFFGNDRALIGAAKQIRKVKDNIILCGFDTDEVVFYLDYKVYSVKQNFEIICKKAMEVLLSDKNENILIRGEIINNT